LKPATNRRITAKLGRSKEVMESTKHPTQSWLEGCSCCQIKVLGKGGALLENIAVDEGTIPSTDIHNCEYVFG